MDHLNRGKINYGGKKAIRAINNWVARRDTKPKVDADRQIQSEAAVQEFVGEAKTHRVASI